MFTDFEQKRHWWVALITGVMIMILIGAIWGSHGACLYDLTHYDWERVKPFPTPPMVRWGILVAELWCLFGLNFLAGIGAYMRIPVTKKVPLFSIGDCGLKMTMWDAIIPWIYVVVLLIVVGAICGKYFGGMNQVACLGAYGMIMWVLGFGAIYNTICYIWSRIERDAERESVRAEEGI